MTVTTKDMFTAVRDLAAAVVAGGDLSRIGLVEAGIWEEDDKAALKVKIAGSILLLKDDRYSPYGCDGPLGGPAPAPA